MEKINKVLVILLILALIIIGYFGFLINKYFRRNLYEAKNEYMTLRAIDEAGYELKTKKEYENKETFEALYNDINFDATKEIYELVKKEDVKDMENTENN